MIYQKVSNLMSLQEIRQPAGSCTVFTFFCSQWSLRALQKNRDIQQPNK